MESPNVVADGWILDYLAHQVVKTFVVTGADEDNWAELLQSFLLQVKKTRDRVTPTATMHTRLLFAKLIGLVWLNEPRDLHLAIPVFLEMHSNQELRTQPVISLLLMLCTQAVLRQMDSKTSAKAFFNMVERAFEPGLQLCRELNLPQDWQHIFEDAIKELINIVDSENSEIYLDVLDELREKHDESVFRRQLIGHIRDKASQLDHPVILQLAASDSAAPSAASFSRAPGINSIGTQPVGLQALRANFRGTEAEWQRVIDMRHRDVQQFYSDARDAPMSRRTPLRDYAGDGYGDRSFAADYDRRPITRPFSSFRYDGDLESDSYSRRSAPPPRLLPPVEQPRQFEVARQLQASRQQLMSMVNDPLEEIERSMTGARPVSVSTYISPVKRSAPRPVAPPSDDVEAEAEEDEEEEERAESSAAAARRARRPVQPLQMQRDDESEEEAQASGDDEAPKSSPTKRVKLRDADTSHVSPLKRDKGIGKRVKFQPWEVSNLLEGVRQHGRNWEMIRALYKFQGRTGVDLKDKYRNLQKVGAIPKSPSH